MEATERLLAGASLHELTTADILTEASVSRAGFYSHFASKGEVVAALLEQAMEGVYGVFSPLVEDPGSEVSRDAIAHMLTMCMTVWNEHLGVFNAMHENWHSDADIRKTWLHAVERFTDAIAGYLESAISAGHAPDGIDVRQRAAGILWASEHLFYLAGTDTDENMPSVHGILETLLVMWEGTLSLPGLGQR